MELTFRISAVRNNRLECVRMLLDVKCDAHIVDQNQFLPVHLAVQQTNFDLYKLLVEHHTPQEIKDMEDSKGNSLLYLAVQAAQSSDIVLDLTNTHKISTLKRNQDDDDVYEIVRHQNYANNALQRTIKEFIRTLYSKELHGKEGSINSESRPPLIFGNADKNFSKTERGLSVEDDFRLMSDWLGAQGINDPQQCAKILHANHVKYDDMHTLTEQVQGL